MANISFKGFVQKHEGNRPWEISESHRKKNDQDQWFTESTTYHKVWLPRDHAGLNEGDLVEVTGQQKTPKKTGDYKPTPVVYAETVTVVKAGAPKPVQSAGDSWNTPGTYSDESPF